MPTGAEAEKPCFNMKWAKGEVQREEVFAYTTGQVVIDKMGFVIIEIPKFIANCPFSHSFS